MGNGLAPLKQGAGRRWFRFTSFSRSAVPLVLLVACLAGTFLATVDAVQRERESRRQRFTNRVNLIRQSFTERLHSYELLVRGAGGLMTGSPSATPQQWRAYFEQLDFSQDFRGVHALGYIARVAPDRVEDFVAEVRRSGRGRESYEGFSVWPDTNRESLYVVKYVEPQTRNQPALGYDIGEEPFRRAAAEQARDTGEPTVSRAIRLVQAPEAAGVLLLFPVYEGDAPPATVAERRERLRGWTYAALLLARIAGEASTMGEDIVGMDIYEGTEILPVNLLHSYKATNQLAGITGSNAPLSASTDVPFGGHTWTLHFSADPARLTNSSYSMPRFIGLGGLCISLLTFGIARSLSNSEHRAMSLANRATQQLRLQQRAIASANEGIVILAATEGNPIIYANPAFLKMIGYSQPELLGQETTFLFKGEVDQPELPRLLQALKGGHETRALLRECRKDGTPVWVYLRLSPIRDDSGVPTHFLGILENVTERKQAEEQLAKAERRHQSLVNNLAVGVFRVTPGVRGRFIEVNPALVVMCEADDRGHLLGSCVNDLYADPQCGAAFTEELLKQGVVRAHEIQLKTFKGRLFWGSLSATRVTGDEGRVFFEGSLEDITERKRTEQALRESQERFALAVQGTTDGIWDWNVLTNQVYFSPRWKSMLGYENDEVEDNFYGWERLLHPADRDRAMEVIRAHFEGHTSAFELEHRLRHKDGSYRWILARGVAVRDAEGKPLRMAGSHLDLTDRKRAEEDLRRANMELAESQQSLRSALQDLKASHEELKTTQLQLIQAAKLESVGTLAAGVAHEVKNPLQTILLGLDYLDDDTPVTSEGLRPVLHQMRDAVTRANAIVKELLQFSTVTALEMEPEDLNGLVERALWLINYEADAARIRIVRDLCPGLPPVPLDHGKMEQALINVLLNGIQAMTQGGSLTVSTRLSTALSPHAAPQVTLEIVDTGPGIPEDHLARIFDPFFTTKPRGVGTGLGLPIVKKIAELHHARLQVRTLAGGGAAVTFTFNTETSAGTRVAPEAMGSVALPYAQI